jgi:lipoprotein
MKKVLFAVVCLLVICGCKQQKHIIAEQEKGRSKDSLYLEAKDMRGIGIINIFDTKSEIIRKLKKHNAKYRHKFENYNNYIGFGKFGENSVLWSHTLPHKDSYENDNNSKLSYIVDEDKCIDLKLKFHRDTLYEMIAYMFDGADFLKSAFLLKYGNGDGSDLEHEFSDGSYMKQNNRFWENNNIKAVYHYYFSSGGKEKPYFDCSFSIFIKDSTFYTRMSDFNNEKLRAKQLAEEEKRKEQYNKI